MERSKGLLRLAEESAKPYQTMAPKELLKVLKQIEKSGVRVAEK